MNQLRIAWAGIMLGIAVWSQAADTGIIHGQRLNIALELPTTEKAIAASAAEAAAARHIADILGADAPSDDHPAAAYWRDYRSVLARYPEVSVAKPVFVPDMTGQPRIARWLVGLRMDDAIGGFLAIDPESGALLSRLMFTPELKPLFRVPIKVWTAAPDVNSIVELAELVPPLTQFTTGIPIDPTAANVHIIDYVLDLPKKTQEERRETVEAFNQGMGREAGVTLQHTLGRRTATSKCLAVAASYVADWWLVVSGESLLPYRNAVGGQQEYGINPRHLESLYYKRSRQEAGLLGRGLLRLGNRLGTHVYARGPFKQVGRDRVTGEGIPYSPRGYARILSETTAGTVPDPLVPGLVSYTHANNPFAMDEPPLLMVLDRNFMARRTRRQDERRFTRPQAPFQIVDWRASRLSPAEMEERLMDALNTWGPLYAQHMQRDRRGNPQRGMRAKGVHACVIVGHVEIDGRMHFIYRETFGEASHRYLEDSFLGPSYRAFPIEFFYQAIAFPHTLQPTLVDVTLNSEGERTGRLEIRTNRGRTLIDPDHIEVIASNQPLAVALKREGPGRYRFQIPATPDTAGQPIEFQVRKRYFASGNGQQLFSATLAALP